MTPNRIRHRFAVRPIALCLVGAVAAASLGLTACKETVSSSKTSTTKTENTPEGVKKTTESTEKKVEKETK